MYLVGDFSMLRSKFSGPEAVKVKERITKEDLFLSRNLEEVLVINLDDFTVFIPERNAWLPLGK